MDPIPVVEFKKASFKIHDQIILDKITFSIEKNQITGILGLNGAGKTTLLSLINGLHQQTKGEITVLGEKLPLSPTLRKKIGVVLQETALYEDLTTYENLEFSAALYEVKNAKKEIMKTLKLLGISNRKNQIVETLSGGLKRRIAIARALVHAPELLIVDEPTLGVDAEARHAIWSHLRMLKSKGKTIVIATNYLDEVQALCDSVAVLKNGQLTTIATPEQLVSKTGACIDIQCSGQARKNITNSLKKIKDITHVDWTPSGLSIFFKNQLTSRQITKTILSQSKIEGISTRAPDLTEVFKTLKE
jgi:ABC-2 type transport system ATP-binding protein